MVLVYIQTQGCSANKDDSLIMKDLLDNSGFDTTSDVNEIEIADILVFNTCTVKNPTEDKFVNVLRKYRQEGKKIVVAGCIAQSLKPVLEENPRLISIRGLEKDKEKLDNLFEEVSLIGINQVDQIVKAVMAESRGEHIRLLDNKELVKLHQNKNIRPVQTVQILTGCLGAPCTYCKTIFARGKLKSFPLDEIKKRVEELVSKGTKIIHLTSQDNAVWGMDIGMKLPDLLKELIAIPGDFKIRLGMGNPDHYVLYADELADIFNHEKMFRFFHIPIQSGSNKVLTWMRRGYTMEQFDEIFQIISKKVPYLVWATDIICGFPYEQDQDHQNTIDALKKYKFDVVNISQFYPRLGTLAADYPQVNTKIKKARSTEVTRVFEEIAEENKQKRKEHLIDQEIEVIVEDKNKQDLITRSDNYTQVIIKDKSEEYNLGDKLKVKIIDASKWHLIGE